MTSPATKALFARPGPVDIQPEHTAVIVVDMQNDFGSVGGMFDLAGIDITDIQKAVAPTASVVAAARLAGIPIVYLQMQHRSDRSDMGAPNSKHRLIHTHLRVGESVTAPDGTTSRVLVQGEWGTQIVKALAPLPGDIMVPKHRFSGFFETSLQSILQGIGTKFLIFTGCTTSICVESTLRDAMFRDYQCVLLEDCAAEPIGANNSRSNHEASVLTIETGLGWVSDSSAFVTALSS